MPDGSNITATNRTSSGLRDALFDELDALRRGESNPQRATAVAKIAAQIIGSVRMELSFMKLTSDLGTPVVEKNGNAQTKSIALGGK